MVRHFLYISDFSATELLEILQLAGELKTKFRARDDHRPFAGRSLAMIFAKPSARTRVSFETGFSWMGGHALFLGPQDIGIGKREAIKDIARLFSRYNDLIMARLFDHAHILELA
ncbi:MAG: ornithine carbamoyltransferase, partial [Candidatus Poseidoniia archaeon]|nr:ornithine carbamoyltransferase [Candidatus Poseidoniia archaeon]